MALAPVGTWSHVASFVQRPRRMFLPKRENLLKEECFEDRILKRLRIRDQQQRSSRHPVLHLFQVTTWSLLRLYGSWLKMKSLALSQCISAAFSGGQEFPQPRIQPAPLSSSHFTL